jgi:hypothetical protein
MIEWSAAPTLSAIQVCQGLNAVATGLVHGSNNTDRPPASRGCERANRRVFATLRLS